MHLPFSLAAQYAFLLNFFFTLTLFLFYPARSALRTTQTSIKNSFSIFRPTVFPNGSTTFFHRRQTIILHQSETSFRSDAPTIFYRSAFPRSCDRPHVVRIRVVMTFIFQFLIEDQENANRQKFIVLVKKPNGSK